MATFGFGNGNGNGNGGTEFLTMLPPPREAIKDWDKTKKFNEQSFPAPQIFQDAMSVREEVYGEQGVPLEAEFDEDDKRSFHWVVYASVAPTSTSPPPQITQSPVSNGDAEAVRRSSASATRLPIGTIRLIPPPHETIRSNKDDKHADADPPHKVGNYPREPYIKLGRLAILKEYRRLGLSELLINTVLEYATNHPENIQPPPSPTTLELVNRVGKDIEEMIIWRGLAMVHAQVSVERLWAKYGFAEELIDENRNIEVEKEQRWDEEGIEHMGMWKRLRLDTGRL